MSPLLVQSKAGPACDFLEITSYLAPFRRYRV